MMRDDYWPPTAREELRFFGNVTAAISHEINNKLAVINEKAGLLNDLAAMLANGREVSPQRFEDESRKIIDQVRLAKQIVGRLNRFAHTADTEKTTIDVHDVLEFVAELYARKAAAAEIEVSVERAAQPLAVTANPVLLQTLVGRGLDIALSSAGTSRIVTVAVERLGAGVQVCYSGLAGLAEPFACPDPELDVPALLECSGASYRTERNGTVLLLDMSRDETLTHGRTT